MKKQITLAALIMVAALILTATVNAQSKQSFKVDIPFNFEAGGKGFEAGTYKIGRFNPANPMMLILQKVGGKERKILLTVRMESESLEEGRHISFVKYDNKYLLSEVWMGQVVEGVQVALVKQRVEKLQLAGNKLSKEVVAAVPEK